MVLTLQVFNLKLQSAVPTRRTVDAEAEFPWLKFLRPGAAGPGPRTPGPLPRRTASSSVPVTGCR
jgi:hypothetical protein